MHAKGLAPLPFDDFAKFHDLLSVSFRCHNYSEQF